MVTFVNTLIIIWSDLELSKTKLQCSVFLIKIKSSPFVVYDDSVTTFFKNSGTKGISFSTYSISLWLLKL